MNALAETELAKLSDQEIAAIAHDDETIHKIGDVLRIGGKGDTDFASVKVTNSQFAQLNDSDELGRIRRGIMDHHAGKIEDIKFEFKPNGSPDIGTVKVTVTSRSSIPGGKQAGIYALYSATHSISSRFKR